MHSWIRRIPLAWKVTAILWTAVALAVGVAFGVLAYREIQDTRHDLLADTRQTAAIVAELVTASLAFQDTEQAARDLGLLRGEPKALAATLYDRTGEPFAAWRRPATVLTEAPRLPPHVVGPGGRASLVAGRVEVDLPVADAAERLGTLRLHFDARRLDERIARLRGTMVSVGLVLVLLAVVAAIVLHRVVTRRIEDVSRAAAELSAAGDYSRRLQATGGPEIAMLVEGFNRVLAAVEQRERQRDAAEEALRHSEQQRLQSQKMEAMGRLAAGVAHDFNNMLTGILAYARMLADARPPEDPDRQDLEHVVTAAERAADLTRQLLAFSRHQVLHPVPLDLGQVARGMDAMLRRIIGEDVELRIEVAPTIPPVLADPGQMEQVILNLVVNSRDAMPRGGSVTVAVHDTVLQAPLAARHGTLQPGRYAVLSVTDAGTGMDAATMARLFEPFFTTKPRGKGTGLGLSTVFGIVQQSGGDLTVTSELGRGTTVRIYLPCTEATAALVPETAREALAASDETVLLVEDEAVVRAAARKILTTQGYTVLEASNGEAAMQVCADHPERIDLLLTDVVMPGMNGRALAEQLVRLRPGTRVLYMSGYSGDALSGLGQDDVRFLEKPFTPETLLRKVREVLDAGSGQAPLSPRGPDGPGAAGAG